MLASENKNYGFYGTMYNMEYDVDDVWKIAFKKIKKATEQSDKAVRAYLDSGYGRHFADMVIDCDRVTHKGKRLSISQSIDMVIDEQMRYNATRADAHTVRMPNTTPMLIIHVMLADEAEKNN